MQRHGWQPGVSLYSHYNIYIVNYIFTSIEYIISLKIWERRKELNFLWSIHDAGNLSFFGMEVIFTGVYQSEGSGGNNEII